MSSSSEIRLEETLIQFSTDGKFPEDPAIYDTLVDDAALAGALKALKDAESELEIEIRQISKDSAADVDDWIANAQIIQDDIESSRRLASGIVRQAEADEQRLAALEDREQHFIFTKKEAEYQSHIYEALWSLQKLNDQLDQVEELAAGRNVNEALRVLEDAWSKISRESAETTLRAMKILENRCTELRVFIREQFHDVWDFLVNVDMDIKTITISQSLPREVLDLEGAIILLHAFDEIRDVATAFWDNMDEIIVRPRTQVRVGKLTKILIKGDVIKVDPRPADLTIKSLFSDLEDVIRFLINKLPSDFIKYVSDAMMPALSARIKELWLDTAVPSSLDDIVEYQKALFQVSEFADKLDALEWPGTSSLHEWVSNVAKIWLNKRRETALDWTRNQLAYGIGTPRAVEKVEKRMVSRDEGLHFNTEGTVVTDEWDAAWSGDEDEEPKEVSLKRNRSSLDEERRYFQITPLAIPVVPDDDDDAADAWGWGDEDINEVEPEVTEEPQPTLPLSSAAPLASAPNADNVREMTLSENFYTSSMTLPVLETVASIYNDGAFLTQPKNEDLPITPAAPGLFTIPTLIIAMYRAVSPSYYVEHPDGNLFLYNDATWLADQLRIFSEQWKQRQDLSQRIYGLVRLEPEIKTLESFGKRAYTKELAEQRRVLTDLLNGAGNFFMQDPSEIDPGINIVVKHIREREAAWSEILTWSACASAIGSLINAVCSKLINDVFDLDNIGVDEAERIATTLTIFESLENLFVRPAQNPTSSSTNGSETPPISLIAQFVDKWLKMNYLNQVLQSNSADIKFLWLDSELSYYFSSQEVVALIKVSFENNAGVRGVIKQIEGNPRPRGEIS